MVQLVLAVHVEDELVRHVDKLRQPVQLHAAREDGALDAERERVNGDVEETRGGGDDLAHAGRSGHRLRAWWYWWCQPRGPSPPSDSSPTKLGSLVVARLDVARRVDASASRRHRSHDVEEAQRVVSLGEGEGDAVLLELEHGGDLHACHLLLPHVLLPFLYGMQRRDAWYEQDTTEYASIQVYYAVF